MTKKEVLKECNQMLAQGADMEEIYEWIKDNTNFDPVKIVNEIFKIQVFI